MFAACQMGGADTGLPDVCLTPPPAPGVPLPYPNVALGNMALGFVVKVLLAGGPAHNLGCSIPISNGDNAGIGRGPISGTVMGKSRHLTGAFTVLIGGMPASRVTSVALQNSINCPGVRLTPSQLKVILLAP